MALSMACPPKENHHFPFKLYDMLEYAADSEHGSSVSWIEDGRAFAIHDRDEFLTHVVPRFFKQSKFRSFTRQLNLWGFDRFVSETQRGTMAWKHKNFIRGRVDGLGYIERTEIKTGKPRVTKGRRPANGKLDPPRRAASQRDGETRVTPLAQSSPEHTPTIETAVVSVPKETERDAPPAANVQRSNNALVHPLLPNRKFIPKIQATPTIQPFVATPLLHIPSKCLLPATIQDRIRGNDANVAQLPPPSKRSVPTYGRDVLGGSDVDMTQLLRNDAVHIVKRRHSAQQQQRSGTAGVGGGTTDEDDILFLLSGVIEPAENGADISSVSHFNDEVAEDFLNPISF